MTPRDFIIMWNTRYPIDKWWRDKHKIPFGSKKHLSQELIDMRIEFEEDVFFAEQEREFVKQQLQVQDYSPGKGQWLKPRAAIKPNQDEIERDFENIDIDKIQHNSREEIVNGKKQITF